MLLHALIVLYDR